MQKIYTLILTMLFATSFITPDCALAEQNNYLTVGIISTESANSLRQEWEPFLNDMEDKTGMRIKAFFAPDYGGLIEAMRFDQVDIARVGNKSAIEAVDRAGAEVFAQMIGVTGYPGYHSVLIVHKDSEIKDLKTLLENKGRYTFGNGDPNSTSGFLVPSYYVFAKNNIDPKTHFKRITSSNHSFNALAVANKQVDVATNNTTNVGDPARNPRDGRFWEAYPEKADNLRIIWKSPLIPSGPMIYRGNLPEKTKETIKEFFYNYGKNSAEERKILSNLGKGISNIKPADNDLLIPIRILELQREKILVSNDESLSDKNRKEKIIAIDHQLSELGKRESVSR